MLANDMSSALHGFKRELFLDTLLDKDLTKVCRHLIIMLIRGPPPKCVFEAQNAIPPSLLVKSDQRSKHQ